MTNYLALLRGINVGGKNRLKMDALRACFEAIGFEEVRTYIQSGNVIFSSEEAQQGRLAAQIEEALLATFGYELPVVLRRHGELRNVVAQVPEGFGEEPDAFRYDVIFLKAPLTAAEAMQHVETREGVDRAHAGEGVLYFSRLIARASSSRLSRLVSTPVYGRMTIRNWRTTTRLLEMMGEIR